LTGIVSKYPDKHKGEPSVGALIDSDDFKYINDLYGHDAGDAALKTFAKVLEDNFDQLGKVCRNGGDEFAVTGLMTGRSFLPTGNCCGLRNALAWKCLSNLSAGKSRA
jgi:hypothetical protein